MLVEQVRGVMIEQGAWAQGLRPFKDLQAICIGAKVALTRMLRCECRKVYCEKQ